MHDAGDQVWLNRFDRDGTNYDRTSIEWRTTAIRPFRPSVVLLHCLAYEPLFSHHPQPWLLHLADGVHSGPQQGAPLAWIAARTFGVVVALAIVLEPMADHGAIVKIYQHGRTPLRLSLRTDLAMENAERRGSM